MSKRLAGIFSLERGFRDLPARGFWREARTSSGAGRCPPCCNRSGRRSTGRGTGEPHSPYFRTKSGGPAAREDLRPPRGSDNGRANACPFAPSSPARCTSRSKVSPSPASANSSSPRRASPQPPAPSLPPSVDRAAIPQFPRSIEISKNCTIHKVSKENYYLVARFLRCVDGVGGALRAKDAVHLSHAPSGVQIGSKMPVVHQTGGEFPAARVAPISRLDDIRRYPFPPRVPRRLLSHDVAPLGPPVLLLLHETHIRRRGKGTWEEGSKKGTITYVGRVRGPPLATGVGRRRMLLMLLVFVVLLKLRHILREIVQFRLPFATGVTPQ